MVSVADLIVRHLRDAGVGFIFGVPGGGSNRDLIDAAGRAGLRFVLTAGDDRHVPFVAQLVTDIPSGMQLASELLPQTAWDLDAVHRTVVAQRQRLCPQTDRLAARPDRDRSAD